MRRIDDITEAIIGDAIAVHRELGPGLLESTYEACLAELIARRGLRVERQVGMPVMFQGRRLDCGYRLDLFVERRVVVELKTTAKLEPVHFAQMLTYLKLSGCTVGLLINFNVDRLKDGIRRVVLGYKEPGSSSSTTGAAGGGQGTESIAEDAEVKAEDERILVTKKQNQRLSRRPRRSTLGDLGD